MLCSFTTGRVSELFDRTLSCGKKSPFSFDRNASHRLGQTCLFRFPTFFACSSSSPQSSTLPFALALSQMAAQKRTFAATTLTCINLWCATTREESKRPLTTSRLGEWMISFDKDHELLWSYTINLHSHTKLHYLFLFPVVNSVEILIILLTLVWV